MVLVLGLLVGGPAAAQEALASLDRDTVALGDTVVLRIDVSDPASDAAPDYAALAPDLEVLETGTSARIEMNNDRRSMQVTHTAVLEPRREGQLVIPPLPVAGTRTRPLTLTVTPPPDGRESVSDDLFLEIEAEPHDPYVHAQVRVTVRLYHAPPIIEGSLQPESWPDGAVVERLGDDRTYQTRLADRSYRVIERRYALFPERSGPLTVPEIRFRGRVADSGRGMNSLFSTGRLVTVRSMPIDLTVRPQPASYSGQVWLPAAGFELTEAWPQGEPEFVVGEPLTRTLKTRARGLLAAQLPEFALPEIDGFKIYPDQPTSQTRTDGSWVLAQRDESYALVPTRPGRLMLPEMRIPWWDTVADRERVIVIPARELQVAPASATAATSAAPLALPDSAVLGGGPSRPSVRAQAHWWREMAALVTVLWLATVWLWLRARRPASTPATPRAEDPSVAAWRRRFTEACARDEAAVASRALLGWASAEWGSPVRSLASLATRLDDEAAARAVRALERHRYAPEPPPWRGAELSRALGGRLRIKRPERRPRRPPVVLPPLYPDTR